jgi:hypothetical protein
MTRISKIRNTMIGTGRGASVIAVTLRIPKCLSLFYGCYEYDLYHQGQSYQLKMIEIHNTGKLSSSL